jgi:hypothetical protein
MDPHHHPIKMRYHPHHHPHGYHHEGNFIQINTGAHKTGKANLSSNGKKVSNSGKKNNSSLKKRLFNQFMGSSGKKSQTLSNFGSAGPLGNSSISTSAIAN